MEAPRMAHPHVAPKGGVDGAPLVDGGPFFFGDRSDSDVQQALLEEARGACDAAVSSRASWRLFGIVFLCCFSPALFGFAMGFTSPVQISMEGQPKGHEDPVYPPEHLSVLSSVEFTAYASAINIGGVLGAFAGSTAMDRIGRKSALALSAVPHVIAWLGTALVSEPAPLIFLRMVAGFGVGMGTAIAPCYIGEIAPAYLGGVLGVAIALAMNAGRLFVNAAGIFSLAVDEVDGHHFCNWRRLSLFGVAFAALLAATGLAPESPKWLAQKGRMDEARLALRALRSGDIAAEEVELEALAKPSAAKASTQATSAPRLMEYKRSLVVAIGLMCFQQLSGINAIMMYAMDIFERAGMRHVELCCIAVMASQVVLGALPFLLLQAVGRRPLLQFAGITMCLSHVGLAYDMMARDTTLWAPSWLPVAFLGLYVVGFSTGMGPVPWIVLPELFPVEMVGTASAIATGVGWTFAFVVCVEFRALRATFGSIWVFVLFAVFCLACLIFVTVLVPETKGKRLEEVLADLREMRGMRGAMTSPHLGLPVDR